MADKFVEAKKRLGLARNAMGFGDASRKVVNIAKEFNARGVFPEKDM